MLSADGSGVAYRRRTVIFRCGRYLASERSGFRSGRGQPLGAFREQLGSRRGGRGWDTTMVARRVWVTGVTAVTVYLVLFLVVPPRLT